VKAKLEILAQSEGFPDTKSLLTKCVVDSVCPGICTNDGCTHTTEVEPDQREGWCEACGTATVVSALVLADLV
jgi:hypothetical protein